MDARQQLVEEWKAKLAASAPTDKDDEQRFTWVRHIYTRIYRFLISYYGEGEWRGTGVHSRASADLSASASHMPFVDYRPTTDGLAPKSPERIRAALSSIHSSNPGIATAGTMVAIEDDSWVVVAAAKKPQFARFIQQRLTACRMEALLQDRTTDMAILVRHEDFQDALAIVQNAGRPRKIQIRTRATVNPTAAVGMFLIILSVLTFLAYILLIDTMHTATPLAVCALWIAGLASGWLCVRSRRLR